MGRGPGAGMRMMQARRARRGDQRRGDLLRILHDPRMRTELGLTDDQVKKLEEIAFNTPKSLIQHSSDLRVRQLELGRLTTAENPDKSAIDRKLQEVAQAQSALSRARIYGLIDARAVLTAEQRSKLQDLRRRVPEMRGRPMTPPPAAPGEPQTPPR
ncbi:MAG: periplasmic heavy metal sensor [Acidobacteria bacterium]|nr:periplasmic heavy metal sensor [Acidobacteriota bacterium]